MSTNSSFVNAGDVDLFAERIGVGSPILVCGGPQLGHAYMRVFDFLADTYELIYHDARGAGRSPLGDASKLTIAQSVADLDAVRTGLSIDRCIVLGHSLGGHMGYLYAAAHPEVVDALVLVDVGPPLDRSQAAELERAMRAARTPEDDAQFAQIGASPEFERRDPKTVERFILNIYAPFFRDRRTIETLDMGFTDITAANVLDYEEVLVASIAQEDPLARLKAISSPTLVMHGEIDPIPVAFDRFLAETIPNAQFTLIPGASHFPFLEDGDAFEPPLRSFLATLGSASTRQ